MAEQSDITSEWYVGEDKVFPFTIYQKSAAGVLSTTPQAITGWALRWDVRLNDNAADPPIITKTTAPGSRSRTARTARARSPSTTPTPIRSPRACIGIR
jgi:hypothetical protein